MAQLPEGFLDGPPSTAQTLFLPHPGTLGTVVRQHRGRRSARPRRFSGPEAALAWCQTHRVGLVYWFNPSPEGN